MSLSDQMPNDGLLQGAEAERKETFLRVNLERLDTKVVWRVRTLIKRLTTSTKESVGMCCCYLLVCIQNVRWRS